MPPKDSKDLKALTLLRRAGTEPIMSMVRVGSGMEFTSAMTRMIMRNVHLALMSRRNEIIELNATENGYAPEQRDEAEPVMQWVRVAVKPGFGPKPKGVADHWSDTVTFDTSNKPKFKGLTTKKGSGKPSFVFKEIPYDEWRKHYAKDKFGIFRGTEAPAEDTILVPEDEVKWRSPPPPPPSAVETKADLPVEPERVLSPPPPLMESIKRSATLPEDFQESDPNAVQLQGSSAQASKAQRTQQEQAVFVDNTGHAASCIVQEIKIEPASPSSSAAPIFLSPPTSPI